MNVSPRSRLYRLEPAGQGSTQIESLTSFVMRLAAAHHMAPGHLIRTCLPQLASRPDGSWRQIGDVATTASFANGVRKAAGLWVSAVEEATGRNDLAGSTFLPWMRVLGDRHLLRNVMAYCPICLAEMASTEVVHEPLMWAVRSVTHCVKHGRPLEVDCWHCGRSQRAFRWHGRPGICGKCRRWLGTANAPKKTAMADGLDVSRAIGSMLLSPPAPEIEALDVGQALTRGMAGLGSNDAAFGRATDLGTASVFVWRRGAHRMSLPSAARACAVGGWDLGAFLGGGILKTSAGSSFAPARSSKERLFDWSAVRQEVIGHAADDPPITQLALAKEIGVTRRWLRTRLPEETQALMDRRRTWEKDQVAAGAQSRLALVAESTLRLLEKHGSAPARQVESCLPKSTSLREPKLGDEWRRTKSRWLRDHPAAGCAT